MIYMPKTVVIIDSAVENNRYLRNAIAPEIEIFNLEATQDGIEQIAKILEQFPSIASLHIVAHGSPGCLYLGNSQLNLETIDRYRQQLQSWSLANLFLYGCNIAVGDAGAELIEKLHRYTGAEIAASTTPIGNVNLGGRGELDFATAKLESQLALSKEILEQYPALLATPQNDSASTNEDILLPSIDVLVNDAIQGVARVSILTPPTKGVAVVNGDGTINYTPNPNANGSDTIVYNVIDIFVPTTANADRAIVSQNSSGQIINVLFNDVDPQGTNTLTVSLPPSGTSTRGGTLTRNPDNTITYTPIAGYAGPDSFEYTIADPDGNTSIATVELEVRQADPRTFHYLPPQVTGSQHADYRLFLRITTESATGATGKVLLSDGTTQLTTFSITGNTSFSYELSDLNNNGRTNAFNTAELKGLFVQSDSGAPVNVQLVQETENGQSYLTSKGRDALGTRFYAGEPYNEGGEGNAPESHISVIATENNTQVTFTRPTDATWNWFGQTSGTFTVTLNAGQSFVARADDVNVAGNESVTGALVQSDKPIAVSSGAMGFRSGGAIDNGWDQLVPVERIGTEYVVVKARSPRELSYVVATEDNTEIRVGGNLVATLLAGQVYTFAFSSSDSEGTPAYIQSSKPTYVYQNSGQNTGNGEDDISLIPPINPSGRTAVRIRAPINDNTINVITATSAIPTLKLIRLSDNTQIALPTAQAKQVPGRSDISILSFAGPSSGGTLDANTPQEYRIESTSFIQVGILAATPPGGGFGYLSGFGLGSIQATDDIIVATTQTPIEINVLANDYDTAQTPQALVISNFATTSLLGGTIAKVDPANPSDGRFIYTPPVGNPVGDQFDYSVKTADGLFGAQAVVRVNIADTKQATVNITVNPIPDPPAIDLNRGDNTTGNYQSVATGNSVAVPVVNASTTGTTPDPDNNIFSDPDSAAEIASITIAVTGVRDGANEVLNVSGVLIPLVGDGTSDQTIAGIPLRLIVSGTGDADPNNDVVTITTPDGSKIPTAAINSLFATPNGVTYQNNLPTPTGGDRVFTITASDGALSSAPVTSTISVNSDTDNDGILNANDLDDDNDGIPDTVEENGTPNRDSDADGIFDSLDLDSDNDGITDFRESGIAASFDTNNDGRIDSGFGANGLADAVETSPESGAINYTIADTNGDGIRDFQTIDSDGDGIPDIVEAGGIDTNNDGKVDAPVTDSNFNGLSDGLETTPLPVPDSDGDGIPNYRDLDSDNDGITDAIEQNIDTDGDGTPNYLDLDSDADGIVDLRESGIAANLDTNFDGRIDSGFGANGLADAVETAPDSGAINYTVADSDGDGVVDAQDLDSDNDGITDAVEGITTNGDTDSDGTPDYRDLDSDGDGISDLRESGLTLALLSTLDTNGDGRIDSGFGANGLANAVETTPDSGQTDYNRDGTPDSPANTDGDSGGERGGIPDFQDLDSDNDGILDSTEQAGDPNRDSDGDGIPNYRDLDSDNDGINDVVEAGGTDTDGNGIIDGFVDNNGNGWSDGLESSPLPVPDSDGDGVPDFRDLDSDNDGLPDLTEAGLPASIDANSDGVVDAPDSDRDGINDPVDGQTGAFGDNNGPASNALLDSDGDTIPNYRDLDSDGNGTPDRLQAGLAAGPGTPDANGDGQVDVATDTDGDGIPDSIDSQGVFGGFEDKDNDGTPDLNDLDDDNDGILDTVEQNGNPTRDTDGDGIPDSLDLDSDNDGIVDLVEAGGTDTDSNGIVDGFNDTNGNGVTDSIDAAPLTPPDTDSDGVRDFQDRDSDNDGITDALEASGIDANGDGILDGIVDSDRDGLADSVDRSLNGTPLSLPDNDGDGTRDYRDIDSDGDGRPDIVEVGGIDANNDGRVDNPADINGDGLADTVDPKTGGIPLNPALDADGNGLVDRLDDGDYDDDGVPDTADLDDDNDGILDSSEPTADTDGDRIPDSFDLDSDGDGIVDLVEAGGTDSDGNGIVDGFVDTNGNGVADSADAAPLPVPDTDGDSIRDFQDLDSDNDGIADLVEAGGFDTNGDGRIDSSTDSNGDGIADLVTPGTGGTPLILPDTDGDGLRDYRDRDSDNDGVTDAIEAGGTDANGDGIIDGLTDGNGDGINDGVTGSLVLPVPDRDGDGNPDFRDVDSDGDGIFDLVEMGGTDGDGNGIIDNPTDSNGDGLADLVDPKTGGTLLDLNRDSDRDGIVDRIDPENLIPDGSFDSDGDGIANASDLDDDNDGITDAVEENGNPRLDTDGDSILDRFDLDSDNDGIADLVEANGIDSNGDGRVDNFVDSNGNGWSDSLESSPLPLSDTDGDGVNDFQDTDSDNDGITDTNEAGGVDGNGDGRIDNLVDSNGDGITDVVNTTTGGTPLPVPDVDSDGLPDFQDLDSDSDGIADVIEAGGVDNNGDGILDNFGDSNGDGLADFVDSKTGGTALTVPDTDGDGVQDYRDSDSDNDGITDATEAGGVDANGDGILDNIVDNNDDGIADSVDTTTGGTPLSLPDTDGDGVRDFRDLDSDGDGRFDLVEAGGVDADNNGIVDGFVDSNFDGLADNVDPTTGGVPLNPGIDSNGDGIPDRLDNGDKDNDGILDANDLDDDNDGILDTTEQNGNPTRDTDGDGIPDSFDRDSDNDGITDVVEAGGTDANSDGIVDGFTDTNGNGVADSADAAPLPVPDTDGDGVRDFQDLDSDNDGVTDAIEAGGTDANGDGIIDGFRDSNRDGIADILTVATGGVALLVPDSDGDGTRDFRDIDSDGDGRPDILENGGTDADGNGIVDGFVDSNGNGLANGVDPRTGGSPLFDRDSDNNGLPDRLDNGDRDKDGIPDTTDLDDDNDGILDTTEQNGNPNLDTDGDGIPDSFDLDSDNDGIADVTEAGGVDADGNGIVDGFADTNGNGWSDSADASPLPAPDTDGDGVRDFQDLDSDNDGLTDAVEAGGTDSNGDGAIDNFADANRDGIIDTVTPSTGGTPLSLPDSDSDGNPDFRDVDSDGDGVPDLVEAGGTDADGDGIVDGFIDRNGDGLADSVDPTIGGVPLNPNLDSNGNGIPDRIDKGDRDGDGIPDSNDLDDDNDGILDTTEQNGNPTRDTDGDGIPDSFDRDSDNDGITDVLEAGGSDANGDGTLDGFADTNGNGVADSADAAPLPVPDTDSDGVRDFQDLDSDNDGVTDAVEAGGTDANGDGVIDDFVDADGNGWSDGVDASPLPAPDTDGDGVRDFQDRDSDNDGITDALEGGGTDANGDGIIDNIVDTNKDGIADSITSVTGGTPLPVTDTDGDGVADFRDLDSDGDGRFDIVEAGGTDADGDGRVDSFSDSNGDGLADSVDSKTGGTPLVPSDTDGDGIPDYRDPDRVGVQAVNDRGKTRTNTPIFLNVLANDIANENEILTLIAVTQGQGGTVTINDNGTPSDPSDDFLVYTPNSGFAGNDSFTYTVRDSLGNESTATVNVSVRVPSPANDDSTATLPNEAVSIQVLSNDGRGLRISSVSNGANGTVAINDNGTPNDPSDDFLVYTPNPGFEGDDEFEYTAVDAAGNTFTALVNVKVSASLPLAGDDDIFTAPGDDVFINVLGNDKDPNRQPLRIVSVSPGLRGTATIDDNGTPDDPTDDRILYAPNDLGDSVFSVNRAGSKGLFSIGGNLRSFTDSFSYTVSDPDGNLSTATVNVTVDPEVRLKFTLTGNQAGFVNEVGFFYVDDENGAINGIAPGQEGYVQAALSAGRVVFSSLSQTSQLFGGNPTRIIDGFRTDQLVNFFLVQDGTVDGVLARIQAGQTPANVFFATADANEGSFNHLEIGDLTTGGFTFNWEDRQGGGDRDFNDLALNVEVTDEPVPIGNGLQGNNQQELLDITDFAGQSLQAQVSITREASYSNNVGLYRLEDANGTVRDPITGALLTPGQTGYTEAAKANSVAEFDPNTNSGTVALEGGSFYAPYIIANSGAQTYFPFLAANVNGVDHLRLLGDNTFGYEDLVRGGDFNDAVIKVEFTPIA